MKENHVESYVRFISDYDIFEENETWYTVKPEEIYVEGLAGEELIKFEEGAEIEIISISRDSGYGMAEVFIEGRKTILGLDELYDMVMD
jgi:hypothetical protein